MQASAHFQFSGAADAAAAFVVDTLVVLLVGGGVGDGGMHGSAHKLRAGEGVGVGDMQSSTHLQFAGAADAAAAFVVVGVEKGLLSV